MKIKYMNKYVFYMIKNSIVLDLIAVILFLRLTFKIEHTNNNQFLI